jgi:hypothetical protein
VSYIHTATRATAAAPRYFPQIEPIQVLRAASLAHRQLPAWRNGQHAAAWVDGRAILIPTVELACDVFDVSYPLVAKERCPASLPPKLLAYGWEASTVGERDRFIRENLLQVWTAVERVTA